MTDISIEQLYADYDDRHRRVGKRIDADGRARAALNAMTKNPDEVRELIALCADFEAQMLHFHVVRNAERKMAEHVRRFRQSVQHLKQYELDQSDLAALDRIAAKIEQQQQQTDTILLRLGVTRKSHSKVAAENSALGALAESVVNILGKPYAPQVAILAEVAFGIGAVSEDRVRELLKARRRQSVRSTSK